MMHNQIEAMLSRRSFHVLRTRLRVTRADADANVYRGNRVLAVRRRLDGFRGPGRRGRGGRLGQVRAGRRPKFIREIVGELDPKKTTQEELGLYMAGAKRDEVKA